MCKHESIKKLISKIKSTGLIQRECPDCKKNVLIEISEEGSTVLLI